MRISFCVALCLSVVFSLLAMQPSAKPAIKVENTIITTERIDSLVALIAQKELGDREITAEQKAMLRQNVAGNLLGQELLNLEAEKKKITVKPRELDSIFGLFRQNFPSLEEFKRAMQNARDTESSLKKKLERQIRLEKLLLTRLSPVTPPTDSDMKAFFEKFKTELPVNDTLRALQIVLQVPKGATAAQIEEKRKQIDGFRRDAKSASSPDSVIGRFAMLAMEFSDGPEAKQGGDLGRFRKGDFFPEFDRAIENLDAGDLSEIFRSPMGWQLVFLAEKNDGKFKNYRFRIFQEMVSRKSMENQRELEKYLQELLKKFKVTYLDETYKGKVSLQRQ